MKIIVTGSLGNISKPLAQQLVAEGHDVTVVSSKEDRRAEIEAMGAKAAVGSVADVDFLTQTFTGADAVYAMSPPDFSKTDMVKYQAENGQDYAEALKASGVKRVVFLSSFGAHRDNGTGIIVGKHHAENTLAAELPGVSMTVLRPAYFYYNLYHQMPMVKQGFMAANYGDDKIPMVAPADIAAVAAEELTRTATAPGVNVRYIASDERTGAEVADVLGKAIGNPELKWMQVSDEQSQAGMEGAGIPAQLAGQLNEMYGALRGGGAMSEHYEQNRPAEMGKTKLEDFAHEFAAAYKSDAQGGH